MNFPYKLIDLTHTIDEHVSTWNAHCGFTQHINLDYQDCDGYVKFRVMGFSMNASIGTHIDAPSHCIQGAPAIHDLPIQNLCMPCVIIDVSEQAHENYLVTQHDIIAFENRYGTIPQGSCVMIKSGWERFWSEPAKYRNNLVFPSISLDAANLLVQRNVYALGIDTLSPDLPKNGFQIHQLWLEKNKILIENVAHLYGLPPVGSFVMICPLKIRNATESPIRLIAFIQSSEAIKNPV